MTAAERRRLADIIRAAIEESPLSRYEIARRSGVAQSTLSRFVNRETSLSIDSIEALAPILGVKITAARRGSRK